MTQAEYLHEIVDNDGPVPTDPALFYSDLTSRNHHYIDAASQRKIRDLKILVAGCGAGGGACIEPLARVGVTHFRIADVGRYELTNLNRQHTFVDCIGMNKAAFHERELRRINPHMDVIAHTDGIHERNTDELVQWADIVFDAVDVTTASAISSKIRLHEASHRYRKPVYSMLDLGYCQWGRGFDYRDSKARVLDGRAAAARSEKNPIRAFLKMFPLSAFPSHALQLAADLLEKPGRPASQLGCAADLLSAVAVSAIVRFAKEGAILKGWNINLENLALPLKERLAHQFKAPWLRYKILRALRAGDRNR